MIIKALDVSTAHITQEDARKLENHSDTVTVMSYEYGYIIQFFDFACDEDNILLITPTTLKL